MWNLHQRRKTPVAVLSSPSNCRPVDAVVRFPYSPIATAASMHLEGADMNRYFVIVVALIALIAVAALIALIVVVG